MSQAAEADERSLRNRPPRIGILVVAYNASSTLAATLDRIPVEFRSKIQEVFVCDDASPDDTYLVGLDYQKVTKDLPVTVVRHRENLGYGGNQKAGYQLAAEHGLDIIVLLHGDGQYAPELLPEIVAPLERGECDAVFGSRMMTKGDARKGGMPLYKYLGNRVLTTVENRALGSSLTEFHSGYRAYRVAALADLELAGSSDGFDFDTQIIIQLLDKNKKIVEIPIPTYYGDEICYVNGLSYAADVLKDVAGYRLAQLGFGTGEAIRVPEEYALKESEGSSHVEILKLIEGSPPLRVLDVGCSGGRLAELLRDRGHHVTGIDVFETPEASKRVDVFIKADLELGIPQEVGTDFDLAIAADVVEHVRNADQLLRQMAEHLRPGGRLLLSVPNFGHWYPRLRTVLGIFDYDQRGILDQTHVHFYTRRSLVKAVRKAGYELQTFRVTGLPIDVLQPGSGPLKKLVARLDSWLVRARPTLFGYQFVLSLTPKQALESTTFERSGVKHD
jgi:2-polyprenyl-3-methyl-5-hydroxy-6-metoxy-1,4-benzoquinol methylase